MEEQEGFGNAPCRAGEGTPGVPAESTGAKRSRSAQLVRTGSSLSPAVLAAAGAPLGCAAQTPAGRRRGGKCEVPKRRRGAELTFLAHAGAGCAELACWGTSGPPALTSRSQRRAGQGRAGLDCARHPPWPEYARVWRPALVPPLGAA